MTDLDRRAVLAAAGLDFDDVRYGSATGTSDYWRGFNDGIAKAEEYVAESDLLAVREAAEAVVDAVANWHLPTTVGGPRLSDALNDLRAALHHEDGA